MALTPGRLWTRTAWSEAFGTTGRDFGYGLVFGGVMGLALPLVLLVAAPELWLLTLGIYGGMVLASGVLYAVGPSLGTYVANGVAFSDTADVVRPRGPLRRDAVLTLAALVACAVLVLLLPHPATAFAVSLATVFIASQATVRYRLVLALAAARGRLPLRLARFLDWAHHAGLLRVAGNSYQFRHTEFQRWLVRDGGGRD
ncbi:hypothetical protein ACWCQS_18795 [Streptomyces sp. NPDC002076]